MAKTKNTNTLPEEETKRLERFEKRYNRFFQKTLLAMLSGKVPRRHIPSLVFTQDEACFTDHAKISLGLNQKYYPTDEELYGFIYFVLGHEVGHILCTTPKPWEYGINTGIKHVIAYFQRLYGLPQTTIVGEVEARKVLKKMADAGHLVPSYDLIAQWVHGICNSLEDGRIERFISGIYAGFSRYVRYHRGIAWRANPAQPPIGVVPTSDEKLTLYCNAVLSLATSHVYQNNFWAIYAGTPEAKVVDSLRHHVTKAVYSRKCKQCMREAVEIIDILTPTFASAFLENPLSQFMQMLQQFLEQIMNAHGAEGFSDRKEASESDANANGKSPFGISILGKPEVDENGKITGEIAEMGDGDEGKAMAEAKAADAMEGKGTPGKGSHKAGVAGAGNFSMASLEDEMREAANQIAKDFSISDGNIREEGAAIHKDVSDASSDAAQVAKKHDIDFVEVQRAYTLDVPLPFIIEEQGRILRDRVKDVFRPKKTGAYKRKTKGRVSPERLFTLALNENDLFEIRKKPDKFSGCCYVLQDNSGSMGSGRNSKRMFASEASARIEYAFKDFIPMKIVAFDEGGKIVHEVIKNWNDNFHYSCSYNFFHKGRSGGCNADYHDIVIATDELLARPEKEKILIVISDGLPCGSKGFKGSPEAAVKAAVEAARARGIRVVGIYIEDTVRLADRKSYENMYGSSCVFTDTDHISDELAKVMTAWAH